MKKTTIDTIKSVLVLTIISFVCVGLLAVCNEFLKYTPTLDKEMASWLYQVCPTGEASDENALDYFEILNIEDQIKSVNSANKSTGGKVLAVYRAKSGVNAGRYIVQAQASGRDGDIIMLTAFDSENKISKAVCYSQSESFWFKVNEDWFDNLIGKEDEVTSDDIQASSGATMSLTAVAKAVTISCAMVNEITGA